MFRYDWVMVIWPVIMVLLAIAGVALWWLVAAATDRGGVRRGDATEMATQAVAQLLAFSGERSEDRPAWDGEERMKGFQGNDGATGG